MIFRNVLPLALRIITGANTKKLFAGLGKDRPKVLGSRRFQGGSAIMIALPILVSIVGAQMSPEEAEVVVKAVGGIATSWKAITAGLVALWGVYANIRGQIGAGK